mmetsp:Transcript_104980/g.234341  ORF Transcript_104980/g.234341 Transcript_104980/m.234341 type:complete len:332 (+) Transcript_104980:44-1039(+)
MGQGFCAQGQRGQEDHFVHNDGVPFEVELKCQHLELVTLHVYDIARDSRVQLANELFRPVGSGAFHAGVEVYGREWSFGARQDGSGVFACEPRGNESHRYREALSLGSTALSAAEVVAVTTRLALEWLGRDYDVVTHNCIHFCDAFAEALGVRPVPTWVNNFAGNSAVILRGLQAMHNVWNATYVVLECVLALGVDVASLSRWERCIAARVQPGMLQPIGPRWQPRTFRRLLSDLPVDDVQQWDASLFELAWQPPCLYLKRPDKGTTMLVNGALVKHQTYVLLNNSVISLCDDGDEEPRIAFRVLRNAATLQAELLIGALKSGPLGWTSSR